MFKAAAHVGRICVVVVVGLDVGEFGPDGVVEVTSFVVGEGMGD